MGKHFFLLVLQLICTACLFLGFLGSSPGSAQAPAPSSSSTQNGSQTQSSTQPQAKDPAAPAPSPNPNPDKPKKVWTNENLAEANGNVSVVGDPKHAARGGSSNPQADPQFIANTKKQLEKLEMELGDTNKKLATLKDFNAGESVSYSGYQYRKGYDREPVNDQIRELEEKKKQTQAKIDALLEEARKRGVQPGQLR